MDDDSIAGRAQKLRQDMELLLQEEWRFRRSRTHSLADNNEHDKRKAREESLESLSKKPTERRATDRSGIVDPRSNTSTGSLRMLHTAVRKRE